jgi:hypothetical protein
MVLCALAFCAFGIAQGAAQTFPGLLRVPQLLGNN